MLYNLVFIVVIIYIYMFFLFLFFFNVYLTSFYVKHFELSLCMKCAI